MSTRIALVSCGKLKLVVPSPAKELYRSVLFKKTRAYVEQHYDNWFILSALHRIVHPEQIVDPYEFRMPTRRPPQQLWGYQAAGRLSCLIPEKCLIDVFAGDDYTYICCHLQKAGHTVSMPMSGLQVGQRLQWLNAKLQVNCAPEIPGGVP